MPVRFPRDTVASSSSLGGGGGSEGGEPAAVDSASGKDVILRLTSCISGSSPTTMKAIDIYGRRERICPLTIPG